MNSILREKDIYICGDLVIAPLSEIRENISTVLEDLSEQIVENVEALEETDQLIQYVKKSLHNEQGISPKTDSLQEIPRTSVEYIADSDEPCIHKTLKELPVTAESIQGIKESPNNNQETLPFITAIETSTNKKVLTNDSERGNPDFPRLDIPIILIEPPEDEEEHEDDNGDVEDGESIFVSGLLDELEHLKYHSEDTVEQAEMNLKKIEVISNLNIISALKSCLWETLVPKKKAKKKSDLIGKKVIVQNSLIWQLS